MATVAELSDPYANFMLTPLAPEAPGVCRVCTTFTEGYDTCYPCGWNGRFTDAVLPISYGVRARVSTMRRRRTRDGSWTGEPSSELYEHNDFARASSGSEFRV